MADIDFYAAKPGDICNVEGGIRGVAPDGSPRIIIEGIVGVTNEQATAAQPYRWERVGQENGLVLIRR